MVEIRPSWVFFHPHKMPNIFSPFCWNLPIESCTEGGKVLSLNVAHWAICIIQRVCICAWMLNLQNHCSKMALAIVCASLLGMDVTTAYFVNASVIHRMYADFLEASTIGPKRSAWRRVFGMSSIGNRAKGEFFFLVVLRCWQRRHDCLWFSTWE